MKYTLTEEQLNTLGYICDLDLKYIIEEAEDISELEEALQEAIQEYEIIYFSSAIDFLKEEDQSLTESLELANGMGYNTNQLNSELLATILIQERMMEEIPTLLEMLEE